MNKRKVPARLYFPALLTISCFLYSGCNSVPPGNPPEGRIIEPVPEPEVKGTTKAVNYMVASLSMRCVPIASGGSSPPIVANSFTMPDRRVNDLPFEVWRTLLRMKMIVPAKSGSSEKTPAYFLLSEFRVPDEGKDGLFEWEMRLVTVSGRETVWRDEIEFFAAPDSGDAEK